MPVGIDGRTGGGEERVVQKLPRHGARKRYARKRDLEDGDLLIAGLEIAGRSLSDRAVVF